MPTVLRRLALIVALVAGTVALTAIAASAHTGWQPEAVAPGSIATLTLSVAAENDDAGTVKVELFFPDGVELSTVEPPIVAGWTVATRPPGGTGADVTWSRPAGPPDESPQLPVRLGTFPAQPGQVQFKVVQTYADGTVARWIQDWPVGAPEPEMPGPVLQLVVGAAGDIPSSTTTSSTTTTTTRPATTTTTDPAASDGGGDSTGLIIGAVALFLVALGVTATIVLRRNRARMDDPPPPPGA